MSKKIVVCDDDEGILDVVSTILSMYNFEVISEIQSTNAVDRIIREKPDVVLVDLWMPVINGGDIAHQLKNNPLTRHIPIIVFTASQEGKNLLKTLQVDGFIAKPFDINNLVKTIESFLPY